MSTEPAKKDNVSPLFDNRKIDLITLQEVAKTFGRSESTIRSWVAHRQIPFVPVRGKTYFRAQSLNDWLKKMEILPWQSSK